VNLLGFSRRFHVWAAPCEDAEHTYESLVRAFEWFGGVPAEVWVDNQKAAVLSHDPGGTVRFNPGFVQLADHYGFRPKACRPHRPQTKGKDERMVRYVKENFFQRYRSFESLAHLNQWLEPWLREVADPRVHGTLKVPVSERFREEKPHLQPLPPVRFDTRRTEQPLQRPGPPVRGAGDHPSYPGRWPEGLRCRRAPGGRAPAAAPGRGLGRGSRTSPPAVVGPRCPGPGPERLRGGWIMELSSLMQKLKMESLPGNLDALCEQAAKRELDYRTFLTEALATEWNGRHQKGLESRLKQARLPWIKTLEQFDFSFQPSIDRKVIRELAGGAFIERAENVIFLGPPGVGKTHFSWPGVTRRRPPFSPPTRGSWTGARCSPTR